MLYENGLKTWYGLCLRFGRGSTAAGRGEQTATAWHARYAHVRAQPSVRTPSPASAIRLCARAAISPAQQPRRSPTTKPSTLKSCERRLTGRGAALLQDKRWRGAARAHSACVPSGWLSRLNPLSLIIGCLPPAQLSRAILLPRRIHDNGALTELGLSSTFLVSFSCTR
jgi:hypothetical protein